MDRRLGIDIGRVIINGDGPDTSFLNVSLEQAMKAPPIDKALETIERLVPRFPAGVWLISKCGENVARKSLQWLSRRDFWGQTGIPADHVRFCRQRPEKAILCRELGITHFVDDCQDVLDAMDGVVPHRFLFTGNWTATEEAIVDTIPRAVVARRRLALG